MRSCFLGCGLRASVHRPEMVRTTVLYICTLQKPNELQAAFMLGGKMRDMTRNMHILLATIFIGLTASCFLGEVGKMETSANLPTPAKIPQSDIQEIHSPRRAGFCLKAGKVGSAVSWEKGQRKTMEVEAENKQRSGQINE